MRKLLRTASAVCVVAAGALWLVELLKPLAVATQVQMHLVLLVGLLGLGILAAVPGHSRRHIGISTLLSGWVSFGLGAWLYVLTRSSLPYPEALAAMAALGAWVALTALTTESGNH